MSTISQINEVSSDITTEIITTIFAETEIEKLEDVIKKGLEYFATVGAALAKIKDSELYKQRGYKTFEAYLEEKWNLKRAKAFYLIEGYRTMQVLALKPVKKRVLTLSNLENNDYSDINSRELITIVPTSEEQLRPLTRFKSNPDLQREIWKRAVDAAANEARQKGLLKIIVTESHVREQAQKMEQIIRLNNPDNLAPIKSKASGIDFSKVKMGEDIKFINDVELENLDKQRRFESEIRHRKAKKYYHLFESSRKTAEELQVWIEAEGINNVISLRESPEGKLEFCSSDLRFLQSAINSLQWCLEQLQKADSIIDLVPNKI